MAQTINLVLPEWAFLDGHSHEGDPTKGRTIIEHIPTASIYEIFYLDQMEIHLKAEIPSLEFVYHGKLGDENLMVAMYRAGSMDDYEDIMAIMHELADWYCDYSEWEDNNIINEHKAKLN